MIQVKQEPASQSFVLDQSAAILFPPSIQTPVLPPASATNQTVAGKR